MAKGGDAARSLADDSAEEPVVGSAARRVARAINEDAGLWPMATLRGLWPGAVTPRGLWPMIALGSLSLGGAARPVAGAVHEDASVGPITAGAKPVAGAAGPITEGAKRRMSQSSLSACLHRRRFSLALIVALRLIVSSSILVRT